MNDGMDEGEEDRTRLFSSSSLEDETEERTARCRITFDFFFTGLSSESEGDMVVRLDFFDVLFSFELSVSEED